MSKKILGSILLCIFYSCGVLKSDIPQPKTEFRGVWIATVVNIDWPKNSIDIVEKQKLDYLKILDFYKDLNYNAVIVQVRAAGDAFYPTDMAPWSRFLTGTEGENLKWKENPLHWMVQEAHTRGMEFHAWLNPYRATFDLKTEILSPSHDYFTRPDWMIQYGTKYYYDPGLPEVQEKLAGIVEEFTIGYDVDGIHFDDYFYPYTIKDETFADSLTYYNCAKPQQSLSDWRRGNIDSLIKKSHAAIKKNKPWVRFGVSPFGVWKNKATDPRGSDTKAGQTTYEDLYADPLLWMEKGWLDYLAPQLYWSMDLTAASHKKLMDWWAQNSSRTNIYIGNGAYKVRNNADKAWERKHELSDQIKLARKTPQVSGNILFSAKSLMQNNPDVVSLLKRRYYKWPALTPTSYNVNPVDMPVDGPISILQERDSFTLSFAEIGELQYVLMYKSGKQLRPAYKPRDLVQKIFISPDSDKIVVPKNDVKGRYVALTSIDRFGRESRPILVHLTKKNRDGSKR